MRQLHYEIPGLNSQERAYLVGQTSAVLQTDSVGGQAASQLPADIAANRTPWSFLESDLLTRRYVAFLSAADVTVRTFAFFVIECHIGVKPFRCCNFSGFKRINNQKNENFFCYVVRTTEVPYCLNVTYCTFKNAYVGF
jgi:hypothetical protein